MNAPLPDVSEEIRAAIATEIRQYPVHSTYASKLGHPCARNLVHGRRDWDKLKPIPVERKMLFDGGNVIEKHVAKVYLEKAGYEIVEQQRPVNWPEKQIGGRLDFVVKRADLPCEVPVEVKSMAHHSWKKITTIEDLLFSKSSWHRQYPAQLVLYMLQKSVEIGMFLNISKQTYEPRHIWVAQDYTYAEELIKRAEEVVRHMAAGTYPERIAYDESVCGKCDFAFLCLPDIVRAPTAMIDDPDLEVMGQQYLEVKGVERRLKEEIESRVEHVDRALIGTTIEAVWGKSRQPSYDVPLEIENKIKEMKEPFKTFGRSLTIKAIGKLP